MYKKYEAYGKMLENLKKISLVKKSSSKTFMQVSGYPHFENVCSNILAFFFTTGEEHGLNDLFFRSLLELVLKKDVQQTYNDISVERVYKKNNRIDLVLMNDNYIVGIENKIYSGVQNDLKDYKRTLQDLAINEDKEILNILLSLIEEKLIEHSYGFINITYDEWIKQIKLNLGTYVEEANNTWILYLKDFMITINELQSGGDDMNLELLEFIDKNNKDIEKLLSECIELKKIMSQKTKQLSSLIDLDDYKKDMKFNVWCYNPKVWVTSSFVIDIYKSNKKY